MDKTRYLLRTVVFSLGCPLESLGEVLKILFPESHPCRLSFSWTEICESYLHDSDLQQKLRTWQVLDFFLCDMLHWLIFEPVGKQEIQTIQIQQCPDPPTGASTAIKNGQNSKKNLLGQKTVKSRGSVGFRQTWSSGSVMAPGTPYPSVSLTCPGVGLLLI